MSGHYDFPYDDDDTLLVNHVIGPAFETIVNGLIPVMDYGISLLENPHPEMVLDEAEKYFGPGSVLHNFAMGVAAPFMPKDDVPQPPLVGVETNPGPAGRAARRARARLARKVARNQAVKTAPAARPRASPPTIPTSVAAAYSTGLSTTKPSIVRSGDDSCRIRHQELLTLVAGTTAFTATSYSMNPGLASVFPWLSTQTVGWEKYRFRSMRARYFSRCGTSVSGSVILAPDYDAADAPPTSEQQATSFHGASDDAPWKTMEIVFDMKRSRELFIRNGPLAGTQDIKLSDFANLYVCTADASAAANWGKVFIEYDVELLNPQILSGQYQGGSVAAGGGGVAPTKPLGLIPSVANGSIINNVTGDGTYNYITCTNCIVGQNYMATVQVSGSGITALLFDAPSGATLTSLTNDLVNGAGTVMQDVTKIVCTSATMVFRMGATATTVTNGYVIIAPCASVF